jgi:hypothetical protein
LLVRADEKILNKFENFLTDYLGKYNWDNVILFPNAGDRIVYHSTIKLGDKERIKDISAKLVELGVQSFEFRDWTNKFSPPTKERVIKTKNPVFPIN